MEPTTSTDQHRKHLAVLARIMLGGHLDGIALVSLSTNAGVSIHTTTPDGAQIVAGRLGVTAHTVVGKHHSWDGDHRGDSVHITGIGELTHPEPDDTEDDALRALAAEAVAS